MTLPGAQESLTLRSLAPAYCASFTLSAKATVFRMRARSSSIVCSFAGHTEPPVYEEVRVFTGKPFEKATRTDLVSCKALELPHHPSQKRLLDVSEQGVERRWRESSVVFY